MWLTARARPSPVVVHRSSHLPQTQKHCLRVARDFEIAFGCCPCARMRLSSENIPKAGTDPCMTPAWPLPPIPKR